MKFEQTHFQKFNFTTSDIQRFLKSALRDLEIAETDKIPEVKFTYAYQALIKTGMALLAKIGKVKVRSIAGHHVKIIEKMCEILGDEDIRTIGNAMRMKRNADLYGGGELVGEKEANDYLKFIQRVIREARSKL